MLKKVERYMRDNAMTEDGDVLVVGVSGGADSVCLLHILLELRGKLGISLVACHIMHGIRGVEAERDASFVEELCRKHGVPFRAFRRDVPLYASKMGMTLEEAGRYVRREIFAQVMEEEGANKIALAHHEDDLAETVLMNCARGTGIRGLAALRPVRGPYIRPLLNVSRTEIEAYLRNEGIPYCTDSTNNDIDITRNAVRSLILPEMEKMVNIRVKSHLARLSDDAREAEEFLDCECERRSEKYVSAVGDGYIILNVDSEPHIMQSMIVRSVLGKAAGTEKDITRKHVEDILGLFGNVPGKRVDLPYELFAVRQVAGVCICRRKEAVQPVRQKEICLKEGEFRLSGGLLTVQLYDNDGALIPRNVYTKAFDYDKIKGILMLRNRMPGDYIVINPDGRRKTFSNYLTDTKVSREERDYIPVVACGNEILWAIGLRSGESCRIDGDTKRILAMTYRKDNSEG